MFGSDIIRIKIKGYLKNITEKEEFNFEEKGIKTKDKITFISNDVKYTIKYTNSEVLLLREGKDFINTFIFNKKNSKSNYLLKENNYDIDMEVKVSTLEVKDTYIYIEYEIISTSCKYKFKIEMSEIL